MQNYFEGWYFKQQTPTKTIAFIPAFHTSGLKEKSCSLQVITDDLALGANYSEQCFKVNRKNMHITLANSSFSASGAHLDINTADLQVKGDLAFSPLTPLSYDIMGPFALVPFMECRHSVFSLAHHVSGSLTINGDTTTFNNDLGYIEGDRGHSFPSKYLWTQCSHNSHNSENQNQPFSIMLSVANIPMAKTHFTGVIGVILINGHQYRLGTYLGAKVIAIDKTSATIKQGNYTLKVQLLENRHQMLRAPVQGSMTRLIRESVSCSARYIFKRKGEIILDFTSDRASFECQW